MPAVGKISLDTKEWEKSLEQARREGSRTAKSLQKDAAQTGTAIKTVGKDLRSSRRVFSSFAAGAGRELGQLGGVITALASGPIMALTSAIGSLIVLGVQVWDKMTLSAEEYAAKLDRAAQAADKHRAAVDKQVSEDQTYMDRLAELASKEQLSNEAKEEVATLLRNLTSRYGDLGISIDKVTGKIVGMDKAQTAFLEKIRKNRMAVIGGQISSEEARAKLGALSAFDEMAGMAANTNSGKAAKKEIARVMDTGDNFEKKMMAVQFRDKAKTTAAAEAWQKVIDALTKIGELQMEYDKLAEIGRATEKEHAEAMKKRSDAAQREVEAKAAQAKREADIVSDLETQVKLQQLINAGLTEEAEKLKTVEALRKQGITDPAKVDKIYGLQESLREAKFAQVQKEQVKSLYERALQASGKGPDAVETAIKAAEKAKGSSLSGEEAMRVEEMVSLAKSLESAAAAPNFGDLAIRTNSLTARGGFATGAVAPDADKYARAQVEQGKQLVSIVGRIEKLCEEFGTF